MLHELTCLYRLNYKSSKFMARLQKIQIVTYTMEALHENDIFLHNRLKGLENSMVVLAKGPVSDMQDLEN